MVIVFVFVLIPDDGTVFDLKPKNIDYSAQAMQLFSQSGCSSKNAHHETHWRETTPMC